MERPLGALTQVADRRGGGDLGAGAAIAGLARPGRQPSLRARAPGRAGDRGRARGDSLSLFLVRPDKALAFAAGGVLSYRVIGGTAVVSADPVGPRGAEAKVLASFQDQARRRGWQVVLWGAAEPPP